MPVPQITIFLDQSGTLRAEVPGKNGARRKIELPLDFAAANPELMTELQAQDADLKASARAKLRELQNQNIQYVAQRQDTDFAAKIWHNGDLAFNRSVARKLREAAGLEAEKSTSKSKPRQPTQAISIDLNREL